MNYARQRFRFQDSHGERHWVRQRQRPDHAGHLPHGRAGDGEERVPVEHPGPADVVRDPRQQERLHRADAALRPDARAQRRDLREGRRRSAIRRLPDVRFVVAARRQAEAPRRDLPRRAARRDVQRHVQGRARAHPDEEHRLCRRAGGADRHGHRDHRRPSPRKSTRRRSRCSIRTRRRSRSATTTRRRISTARCRSISRRWMRPRTAS